MSYWVLLIFSLAFSAVGFYMYIYFFSLGYGLAVAALGVVLAVGFRQSIGAVELLVCILLLVYGLRLAGYLLVRELKSAAYRTVLSPEMERSRQMGMGPKLAIWISCALLYTVEVIPVYFRLQNGAAPDALLTVGCLVMLFGLALETAADVQKTLAKRKDPYRFVSTGLYRIVRCPNYLGEVVFWLGVLLSGISALEGPVQWTLAVLGYLCLIYIMFSGARRLEIRQDRNYGEDPAYKDYCRRVPILLPLIPLYSVKKYRFLVA